MEEHIFSIRYEGPNISEGLEPGAFIEALRGFAEFVSTVSEETYGENTGTTLKIHRLTEGSLILELLQKVGEVTINDMLGVTMTVGSQIKQVIELLKHLRGQPPKTLEPISDNRVAVTNNSGVVNIFHNSSVNLVVNSDAGESAERFTRPLTDGTATGYALEVDARAVTTVSSDDAPAMVSVARDQELLENESDIWLTATKVVLQGEAKWTFSDGRRPFTAPVVDREFLASVEAGRERFGKGDRLLVRLRAKQFQRGNRLSTQYEVTKVHRHERRSIDIQQNLI